MEQDLEFSKRRRIKAIELGGPLYSRWWSCCCEQSSQFAAQPLRTPHNPTWPHLSGKSSKQWVRSILSSAAWIFWTIIRFLSSSLMYKILHRLRYQISHLNLKLHKQVRDLGTGLIPHQETHRLRILFRFWPVWRSGCCGCVPTELRQLLEMKQVSNTTTTTISHHAKPYFFLGESNSHDPSLSEVSPVGLFI